MKKLTLADVHPPRVYESIREDMRKRVIELKRRRRIHVGDVVTLVFENRTTMIFQVDEMLRAEHLSEPAKIQHEVDTYNELLPDAGELSATLLVEVTEQAEIRPTLQRLVGLDEHVTLEVDGRAVRARFEAGRSEAERISSVQYLRFRLSEEEQAALRRPGATLALAIDHPAYRHRVALGEETRAALAGDLD